MGLQLLLVFDEALPEVFDLLKDESLDLLDDLSDRMIPNV